LKNPTPVHPVSRAIPKIAVTVFTACSLRGWRLFHPARIAGAMPTGVAGNRVEMVFWG
jgi:hypothetical protein